MTITEKEFDAISFAINIIQLEIETADEDTFIDNARNSQNALYGIMEKYKKAKIKNEMFKEAKKIVAKKNPTLQQREINKMARKLLKAWDSI